MKLDPGRYGAPPKALSQITIALRDYQQAAVDDVRAAFAAKRWPVLFVLPTGGGKCLARGTQVLMFDGTTRPVEDVRPGDAVMGPDGAPRCVASLARGREMMYCVTPETGTPYTVNESHILSLRNARGVVKNIAVRDYVREPQHWRIRNPGWRVPGILRGDLAPELSHITVEPVGEGDYFGFELAGPDRLFLLGDFTVTHNTYTFSYIAHSAAKLGRRVCIIVHRKELLLQASASLRNLGIEHGLISPQFTPQPHHSVQVASVDTLIQRLKRGAMRFDLIIYDEAHHVVGGNKWARVYELLGSSPMLGVTATPVRTDGKGLGRDHGGLFATMVLGPSVRELIERGMLIEPTVFSSPITPDLTGVRKDAGGDYNASALAERVDKPVITGSAVEHYQQICPGRRAIVFCASIEHATHVRDAFNAAGYRFALLVGQPTMSDAERTAVNKALRAGELDGACTVDLVSEGYDLPDLEVCIMLRATASEALFLQQVGRVMRPSPGKTQCWLLDHVANVGKWDENGEFQRKHGLPGEAREWTLEGRKKKDKKATPDDEPVVPPKQCPECYVVHEPAPECPACGHVYEVKARGLEQVDGRLTQVTPEMAASIMAAKKARIKKAKTLADLLMIEQEMGYKSGWAQATFTARARVRERYQRPTPPIEAYEADFFRR